MEKICHVCIPHTSRDFFSYSCDGLQPIIGARVWVPFRNHTKLGVIIETNLPSSDMPLKSILEIIDEKPIFDTELLNLCIWVGKYYQAPLSEVLPMALPKKYRLGGEAILPFVMCYQLSMPLEKAQESLSGQAKKQKALLQYLHESKVPLTMKELENAGFNATILKKLIEQSLVITSRKKKPAFPNASEIHEPLPLNMEQSEVVRIIGESLNRYACFLLQGVTGSGKTEVYLQIVAKVLEKGRQVLVLVPEIGLTPLLLSRFTQRFREPMVVIHSRLNDTERQIAWQMASENQAKLIIGTRAAIFTPLPQLGLIVIDEEHDLSLKQMDGVRYSARDTALMRAFNLNIPIILGSATPSLESMHNAMKNKYQLLRLNHKALTSTPLHYQLVDIRNQFLDHGLSTKVIETIRTHLNQNNQVMIFINRRGFAPVLLCHPCGWMVDCKACDSHLTLHKTNQLVCHHCGYTRMKPLQCEKCHAKELQPVGAGTQRISDAMKMHFPDTSIARIDRDTMMGKHDLELSLESIQKGETQLIVGTQMLAKGHHFPRLTLVVILDADTGLFNHDFKALEHLGQLLIQVSGRAGRAQYPGYVCIQTHQPDHPLLLTLIQQGYDTFAKQLLQSRKEAALPPWHFMALLRAQARKPEPVIQFLKMVKTRLSTSDIQVLGPAPAPLARKGYQHRMQLLIKTPSRKILQDTLTQLRTWLIASNPVKNVQWNVDVDPVDLS